LSWQQVGEPSCCTGHASDINAIAIRLTGTPIDSASEDTHVRFWQLPDRQTIAIFQHPHLTDYITFFIDDRHTLGGGIDMTISERVVPKDALPEEALNTLESMVFFRCFLVPASSHLMSF
jgi:WD40 repeat protein